jgi:hypothetical protein
MTKSELKEVAKSVQYSEAGLGKDYLARALSSLIRSARSSKSQNEIMAIAVAHGVTSNPEFIA